MAVKSLLWWKHRNKAGQYSSARVHSTLHVEKDGSYTLTNLNGLQPEEIEGF